jgi:hypothetical protein
MPIGGPVQGIDRSPLNSKKDDGDCFLHKILGAKEKYLESTFS